MEHQVRAFNTAVTSTNLIHDDAVAASLGFRGGLVPGVDVIAYLCHLPARRWGRAWLKRGTIEVSLRTPVYDGDVVTARAAEAEAEAEATAGVGDGAGDGPDVPDGSGQPGRAGGAGRADAIDLWLEDPGGARCAEGRATLPAAAPPAPDPAGWPSGPPPEQPPPATHAALGTGPLGSIEATFRAARAVEYLDDVREELGLFRHEGLAHPGWLLRHANYVLSGNVRLGPWIHVSSRMQLLGTVGDGDLVETRAVVTGTHQRSGHHLVDLDVLQVVDDRPVARIAHTAIFQPRGVDGPAETSLGNARHGAP